MNGFDQALPIPALEPGPITMDDYHAHTPEKFELWDGYLFLPAEYGDERRKLLALLLVNVGLVDAVRLAPRELWQAALDRVYAAG